MDGSDARKTKIEVRNLTKRFGDLLVLDEISFNVGEGEFLSIVGPTGCGKTTFLNTLSKLIPSTAGDIFIYHQNENRSDGHLFITVLAYHVLHSIRVPLRCQGINDSWTTVRKGLSTHVRITTTMKRDDGKIIHIRKSGRPEIFH